MYFSITFTWKGRPIWLPSQKMSLLKKYVFHYTQELIIFLQLAP